MGLSTALLMPPSSLATTANLTELRKSQDAMADLLDTHPRQGEGVFKAVAEAIQVGADAQIPVDIIHMKIAHKKLWGRAGEIAAMVQKARDSGLDIRANVYPYTAGQNNLSSIIPPWAHDGGREKLLERLRDPGARRRMRTEILNGSRLVQPLPGDRRGLGRHAAGLPDEARNAPFQGKRMAELIAARGGDPVEVLFDVLLEEKGSVPTVFFHHSEQDMQLVMKQPWTSIGSDGSAVNTDGSTGRSHPHPRLLRHVSSRPRALRS